MGGIGETITLLDGIHLEGLAAARTTAREVNLSSVAQPAPAADNDMDLVFMSYMNGSKQATSATVIPYQAGDSATGGSSHDAGLPLVSSSAGLGASLAEAVGMLEGQAALERKLTRTQPRGLVKDTIVDGGDVDNFYGGLRTGGASHFPGAALTYSNAGLSAAPSQRAQKTGGTAGLPDAWLRHHFADDRAYQLFATFAGEAKLKKAFQARRKLQNAPTLYFSNEKSLLAMLVARQRMFLTQHKPWDATDVGRILGAATVDANKLTQNGGGGGVAGLSTRNNQLAGLEGRVGRKIKKKLKKAGRITAGVMTGGASEAAYALSDLAGLEGKIGRKIKKGLKKTVKAVGKVTYSVAKAGASYMTGGASNLVTNAAESAVKKKRAPAPTTVARSSAAPRPAVQQSRLPLRQRAQQRRANQQVAVSQQPMYQRQAQPQYTQSYDESYTAPTSGGDYAPPAPQYSQPESGYDDGEW